jgi:hypothetical protein
VVRAAAYARRARTRSRFAVLFSIETRALPLAKARSVADSAVVPLRKLVDADEK